MNLPKKRKAKKPATKTALPTCCNPKRKNNLDEGTVDTNFPNPLEVEDLVPIHVCNWAQAIVCKYPELALQKCQHPDCDFLVHHLCQAAWEQREGHPDTVAHYCCLHHPHYKYQNIIDGSGVSKKLLSSNSGYEMSVDTNAATGELDNNVIESVLDGKNELLRDVSSPATNSIKETTVSHLNKSRQNIVVDGKLYRCNKVRVISKKNNVLYVKYLQCGMALDKADGSKWKPYNEVNRTSSSKKIRCYGTLRAEFSKLRQKEISHYYPTNKAHICYNATESFGPIPETRVSLLLVFPSPSWNISKAVIDKMKESLSSLSGHHWINQSHCGTARQYRKELSMSKSLKKVKDQAMAVIQPYVTRVVSHHYKALTNIKVGAICLHGVDSQYDLMGALHCNYHDDVNKKLPNEHPQSIIMALDPFKLLYEAPADVAEWLDRRLK